MDCLLKNMDDTKLCWADNFDFLLKLLDEISRLILRVYKQRPLRFHDLIHDKRVVDRLHVCRESTIFPTLKNYFFRRNQAKQSLLENGVYARRLDSINFQQSMPIRN